MKRAGSRKAAPASGIFLTGIRRAGPLREPDRFPFTIPFFRAVARHYLPAWVTFLVGFTGWAFSTWPVGLGAGVGAVAAGGRDLERDPTLAGARTFARAFRCRRLRHPRATLFLRAEDVFGFTLRVQRDIEGLGEVEDELRGALREGSWGQRLATGSAAGQRAALVRRYGADPDARSHGETFLHLLQQRLQPRGLYFLDEPETPLSPTRVLALLAILRDRAAQDCQFVIATHSPILMALPGAEILLLEGETIAPIEYREVEHVRITRAFLDDPESFLRRL